MIFTVSNTNQKKTSRLLGTKGEQDAVWVHKVVADTFVWALPGSGPFSKGYWGISAHCCVIWKTCPGHKRLFLQRALRTSHVCITKFLLAEAALKGIHCAAKIIIFSMATFHFKTHLSHAEGYTVSVFIIFHLNTSCVMESQYFNITWLVNETLVSLSKNGVCFWPRAESGNGSTWEFISKRWGTRCHENTH